MGYRGRFAPSPTGVLHIGSAVAAIASFLHARAHAGVWLVRMEDVDEQRAVTGADRAIVNSLARLGMVSDEPVLVQSRRKDAYQEALQRLQCKGLVYPCACTRRQLPASGVYPGHCRAGLQGRPARMQRVRVPDESCCVQDLWQGRFCQQLAAEVGDFVLLRADGFFAYQLACVVDDAFQGITHVIRGMDLLDSAPRQRWLQRQWGFAEPVYGHFPLVKDAQGRKLSKSQRDRSVDLESPADILRFACRHLGLQTPASAPLTEMWRQAIASARTVWAESACNFGFF